MCHFSCQSTSPLTLHGACAHRAEYGGLTWGAQLQEMPPALAKSFGVLVVQVAPGGPAEQAWLMRGDTFAEKRAVDRVAFQAITTVSPITGGTAV